MNNLLSNIILHNLELRIKQQKIFIQKVMKDPCDPVGPPSTGKIGPNFVPIGKNGVLVFPL